MEKVELQNAIRINHRGFLTNSPKRFVLLDNQTGRNEFQVFAVRNVENVLEYAGQMTEETLDDGTKCFVGDFSSVTADGDYYIVAGGYKSRQFVIYDKAYDICMRLALQFFTWQRCGHELGWHGKCHLDDGYIYETGEKADLSGGYHQSCDLRKSPAGIAIGVLGLLRFALLDESAWGQLLTLDEVAWACDYFAKTIQENGAMYNTLSAPFGWGGRTFYQAPAPSSAQWNVTSILAIGYRLFLKNDQERAQKYLESALRSWDFMMGKNRPNGKYRHPDVCPRGMDPDFYYEQCEKNTTADYGYQAQVAADMYRATGEEAYLSHLRKATVELLGCIPTGNIASALQRNDGSGRVVMICGSYAWLPGGLIALCDAYELLGDYKGLRTKIADVAEAVYVQSNSNVWRTVRALFSDADLDAPNGHPVPNCPPPTLRQTIKAYAFYDKGENGRDYYYSLSKNVGGTGLAAFGIFSARAAKLLGEKKYIEVAQSVIDQFLGTNLLDSSCMYAVGYNHVQRRAYGQFFPSTPFIPGAMGVPYPSLDVYKSHAEYDMPCVGMTMYLLAETVSLLKK